MIIKMSVVRIVCYQLALMLFGTVVLGQESAPTGVVYLHSGKRIAGNVAEIDENGKKFLVIELEDGDTLKIPKGQVRSSRIEDPKLVEYNQLLSKMEDTVEAHVEMSEWCRSNLEKGGLSGVNKFSKQREYHLRSILRLDPNHKRTRSLLGYGYDKGRWIHRDLPVQHGYVRDRGKWVPPQSAMIKEWKEGNSEKAKEWKKLIRKFRYSNLKNNQQKYLELLSTATDRDLVGPLIEQFKKETTENADLQMLTLDAIARQDSARARNFLTDMAVLSPSKVIRDRCLDLLNTPHFSKSVAAKRVASRYLSSKNRDTILRAGYVLGVLKQDNVVLPLIEALTTVHMVGPSGNPGSIQAGFGGGQGAGGGVGMQQGSQKPVPKKFDNQTVLEALNIITGQPYGFNQRRWLDWYISKHAVSIQDLRRDE